MKGTTPTGLILAGGTSRRMGRDKALLEVGGKPAIARVAERLARVCDPILVVTDRRDRYPSLGLPVVVDQRPGSGAVGGLHAGLAAAPAPVCVAVACDMPFLSPKVLRVVTEAVAGVDAAVPLVDGWPQPLHAAYRRSLVPVLEVQLGRGPCSLRSLLASPDIRVRWLRASQLPPAASRSLFNMNTPADYRRALQVEDEGDP